MPANSSRKELKALFGILLVLPLLIFAHQASVLVIASLLARLAQVHLFVRLARLVLSSPIHAQLMSESLSGIEPRGLAVAGIPGDLLRLVFPHYILDSRWVTPGAVISAVMGGNTTVLSLLVTRALAELFFFIFGAMLVRYGLQGRDIGSLFSNGTRVRRMLATGVGLFVQAQAIVGLYHLTLAPTSPGLRDTGVGFALSILLRLDAESYDWLINQGLAILIPSALVGLGFLITALLNRVLHRVGILVSPNMTAKSFFLKGHHVVLLLLTLLFAALPASQGYFGTAVTNVLVPEPTRRAILQAVAPAAYVLPSPTATATRIVSPTPLPANAPLPIATSTAVAARTATPRATTTPTGPARVEMRRTERGTVLVVNGQETLIAGMNYNVNYTSFADDFKKARHRRDFRILRDAGVNSIVGWGVYDEATLTIAQEFGIGVLMPFELDPSGSYENQGYRDQVKDEFRQFVLRFKDYPALWGWNPGGDELMHRMDTEQHRTTDKIQHAADLLVELSALAYQLDPARVSVIKEPRDWYIPYLDRALQKARANPQAADPSKYLIYGVNVYGKPDEITNALRVARVNSDERMKVGFLVGEYAPFGLPRKDRAAYYSMIADVVYQVSPMGGYVYVFGPDQPNPQSPNPYDPLRLLVNEFSLLDIEGNPVDDSFSVLTTIWCQLPRPQPCP